jgi:nitroreductase
MKPSHEVDYPIEPLLQQRWSPRAFDTRPVEPAKIASMLEAARWAPSCYNAQPWRYLIATHENPAEFDRLLSCLVEKNQQWARTASVLMISVAHTVFEHSGAPNRSAGHDVGAASAMLTIQAEALGLHVHQMAGFDVSKVKSEYGLHEHFDPMAAMAIGYLGSPESIPEGFRKGEATPGVRKPVSDFAFTKKWGEKFALPPKQH